MIRPNETVHPSEWEWLKCQRSFPKPSDCLEVMILNEVFNSGYKLTAYNDDRRD